MNKILKIVLSVVAILLIIVVAVAAVIFLDVSAYTATGSEQLSPGGTPVGKALVLYDPGLSANSKTVADKVSFDLQIANYTVTLAGIKSSAAATTTDYDIIVIGGPIYAGAPTASVKDALNNLQHDSSAEIGVFGSGSGASAPEDIASIKAAVPALQDGDLSSAIVVKIGETEDLAARSADFVNQLVS